MVNPTEPESKSAFRRRRHSFRPAKYQQPPYSESDCTAGKGDATQTQPRFIDAWMQLDETPVGNVRVGRFRQPFGLTDSTGARELPFLERPTLRTLSPFRQTGIMFSDTALGEQLTWAASGYRYNTDTFGNVVGHNGGYGMATRITGLPFDCGDQQLVHLGIGYSFNDPARDVVQLASTNEFLIGQNPNLGQDSFSTLPVVGVPAFVSTGIVPTNHLSIITTEAAWSSGRNTVESESRWATLETTTGITKFQFNWIHSNLDDPTLGGSNANAFAFRAHLDF